MGTADTMKILRNENADLRAQVERLQRERDATRDREEIYRKALERVNARAQALEAENAKLQAVVKAAGAHYKYNNAESMYCLVEAVRALGQQESNDAKS